MTKQYLGTIFNIILTSLSGVLAVLFAGLLPVAAIISGAVVMVCFFKNSKNHCAAVSFITLTAVSLASIHLHGLTDSALFTALPVFLCIWAPGCALGLSAKKGSSFISTISYGAIGAFLPMLIWFMKTKFIDGTNITQEYINNPVNRIFEIYHRLIPSTAQNVDQIKEMLASLEWYLQQIMAMIMPSFFILLCAAGSYLVFGTGRKLLSKIHAITLEGYPVFRLLQMPRSTTFVLALLFLVSFFTGTSNFSGAITNIIIILSAFYAVCGISVADYFLSAKVSNPFLRILIYLSAFCGLTCAGIFIPILNLPSLLILTGVIDASLDFRHLRKGDIKNEQ